MPSPTGTIFDIKRFAVHDGPGIRTTVFFKGCPLRCWWCHNPESQSPRIDLLYREPLCTGCGRCVAACPHQALAAVDHRIVRNRTRCDGCGACARVCPANAIEQVGRTITIDALDALVRRDVPFFDESGGGVTFSGGEPLAQPDFLEAALIRCGELDIHRAVDTSGFAAADTVRRIARHTDLFLYDIKVMDVRRHQQVTGVPNRRILDNLALLVELGVAVEVRIPIIPGVTDHPDDIDAAALFLGALARPPAVRLLGHHPWAMEKFARFGIDSPLPDGTPAPSPDTLTHLRERFSRNRLTAL